MYLIKMFLRLFLSENNILCEIKNDEVETYF